MFQFLNQGAWAPPPTQFQWMRTFTKVYKRGTVGRSIDIARYSGYEELKQDLARRFGIEGQLEDRYRVGWELVYVDHESDVLLVGDQPWEDFVRCVCCIKILSPQEVQAMSLDGDFWDNVLPNQACSSSDGENSYQAEFIKDIVGVSKEAGGFLISATGCSPGLELPKDESSDQKSHSLEAIPATGCIPSQWRQPSVDSVNNGMYAFTEAQISYTLSGPSRDSLQNGIEIIEVDSFDQASVNPSNSFEDEEQSMELNFDDRASAVGTFRNPGIQDANNVTIKARVENYYTLKFSLSLPPELIELQQLVRKRKVDPEAYNIIYEDEGEKPIGCDYDLQQWIDKSRSLGNTSTIVMLRRKPQKQLTPT